MSSLSVSTRSDVSTSSERSAATTTSGKRNTFFSSTVIPEQDVFPWWQVEILFPHETIRRGALQLEHALKHIDPINKPWQVGNLHEWLANFYIITTKCHTSDEDDFIVPYYSNLGEKVSFDETYTHAELDDKLNRLGKAASLLMEAVEKMSVNDDALDADKEVVLKHFQELKDAFVSYHPFLLGHLADEERLAPDMYAKHGEKHYYQMKQTFIANERSKTGIEVAAWQAFIGAHFHHAGYQLEKYPLPAATALALDPWMSLEGINLYMSNMPAVPRKVTIPEYRQLYEDKWRILIDSCSCEEDPFQSG